MSIVRLSRTSNEINTTYNTPDNAATKVKQLIEEEGNDSLNLRVFVSGGGCSGFQYGFTFDESISEDDTVIKKQGVKANIG